MICETIVLNKERNVTLTCYIQDGIKKRPAMIVIPGGAYMYCSDREADPVASAYLQAGYHAFILRYSVNEHATWPNPLNDFEDAIELIRSNAIKWKIYPDKIACVGFSAGGHLAAAAATMAKHRPNAALLGYAVCSEDVKSCLTSAPDATLYVDEKTCPCFIFSTRNDNVVPIRNSLRMMEALEKYNIFFESHIYAYGPHGFSTASSDIQNPEIPLSNRAKNWINDSIEWLKEVFGDFRDNKMTEPMYGRFINDDRNEYLSLDCTLGLLMDNQESKVVLEPYLKDNSPESLENARKMTLRGILGFMRLSKSQIDDIEQKLKLIKNK